MPPSPRFVGGGIGGEKGCVQFSHRLPWLCCCRSLLTKTKDNLFSIRLTVLTLYKLDRVLNKYNLDYLNTLLLKLFKCNMKNTCSLIIVLLVFSILQSPSWKAAKKRYQILCKKLLKQFDGSGTLPTQHFWQPTYTAFMSIIKLVSWASSSCSSLWPLFQILSLPRSETSSSHLQRLPRLTGALPAYGCADVFSYIQSAT